MMKHRKAEGYSWRARTGGVGCGAVHINVVEVEHETGLGWAVNATDEKSRVQASFVRFRCARRCRDGGTARTRWSSGKLDGCFGIWTNDSGTSVGSGASSRRATVNVGETWKEVAVAPPGAAAAEELAVWSFSLALPPIAFGALGVVFLLLMYTPRPIPPATHCDSY